MQERRLAGDVQRGVGPTWGWGLGSREEIQWVGSRGVWEEMRGRGVRGSILFNI